MRSGCVQKVLKLSSNVSDVFPKVLKLSWIVNECKPLLPGPVGVGVPMRRHAGGRRDPHGHAGGAVDPVRRRGGVVGRCTFQASKIMLKPPGTKHLKLNVMICFRVLLSISTCAATAWGVVGPYAHRVGWVHGNPLVGPPRYCSPRHRMPQLKKRNEIS